MNTDVCTQSLQLGFILGGLAGKRWERLVTLAGLPQMAEDEPTICGLQRVLTVLTDYHEFN